MEKPIVPDGKWENSRAFWPFACAIFLAACALRLLFLGAAIFHPDEAIHGLGSLNFADYRYDPVYHGPLLYHLVALVLHSPLGDSDATARLVPALMGVGVVALTLFSARRWIGDRAALACAAMICISPVMIAYSRRLIHDSLVLALTFGAVLYFQQARETRSRSWEGREARIGVAVLLALFLATKANAFFIIAMLFAFWLCTFLQQRSTVEFRVPLEERADTHWLPLSLFGVVAVAATLAIRGGETQKRNEIFLMAVCVLGCAILWEWLRRTPRETSRTEIASSERAPIDFLTPILALVAGLFFFAFLYGRGFLWLRDGVSPTTFHDIKTAMPRMIEYWRGQQGEPRLPGPHSYYIVLALLYEAPIVLAGIGGIWRASRVRTPFTDLLLWWCFTSFALYALANEKVPWLLVHQLLPLALLGGVWLGSLKWRRIGFRAASFAGAIFLLRGVAATSFARAGDNHEPLFYAQPSDRFGDAFRLALDESVWQKPKSARPDTLWLQSERQWPTAWYVRHTHERANVTATFDPTPDNNLPGAYAGRLVVVPLDDSTTLVSPGWTSLHATKFPSWRTWKASGKTVPGANATTDFLLWPRASWPALAPNRYTKWWLTREATTENGVLSEWSSTPAVVATKD